MKHGIKRTLLGLLGTALLVGGLTACGGHRGWEAMGANGSPEMRERVLERAGKQLQLDDTQKQRLATLADKLRDSRSAVIGTGDPRAEFQALIAGPRFDRANAQTMVETKTAAVRAKSPEVIAAAADFFDSLRPDQQQQVRDFMNKKRGGHRKS